MSRDDLQTHCRNMLAEIQIRNHLLQENSTTVSPLVLFYDNFFLYMVIFSTNRVQRVRSNLRFFFFKENACVVNFSLSNDASNNFFKKI